MALNITTAVIGSGCNAATASPSLAQWDKGQILQISGVELPETYKVEFSNGDTLEAIPAIGTAEGVEIPDKLLYSSSPIRVYIVLSEAEGERNTEYWVTIYVKPREIPEDVEPTPAQQDVIDDLIAQLNTGVGKAEAAADAAEAASQAVQDLGVEAETLAAGAPAAVEKIVDAETGAVTLRFGLPRGADGASPVVTVTTITGGHRVTVTDAAGAHTFDVMDGEDGRSVTGVTMGADYTLTFTFSDGTTWTTPTSIRGETGATPRFTIGTVSTLDPDQSATASITGTPEDPVLNLGIPKGQAGASDAGGVTYDPTESYQSGTAGAALNDLSRQLSDFTMGTVTLESGTFQDANGKTKTNNKARIRCSKMVCITNSLNSMKVPDGYDAWIYFLDKDQALLGNSSWRSGYVKFIDIAPDATRYINFAFRKQGATSTDISSEIETVQSNLMFFASQNARCLPIWNISGGGIELSGRDIIVHPNGFGIVFNGRIFYIAATDQTTETTLTAPLNNSVACIDTKKLGTVGGRTNPADCIVFIQTYQGYNAIPDFYIPIAYWFGTDYGFVFVGDFAYFEHYYQARKNAVKTYQPVSGLLAENQLIAHKGGNTGAENTLSNFETAITNGYKILEMDVRLTSDNVAVLIHDATFTIGGTTYTIASETYENLIAVKPDLATLWDALLLCKQNNVIADIDFTKVTTTDAINATFDCVMKLGMQGRCFITCVSSVARNFLAKTKNLCICISQVNSTSQVDSIADIAQTALVALCSTEYSSITQELVEYMHSKGFLSKPWVANSVSTIKTLFGYGCDMIITDSVKPNEL